mgnify:CR=1 FL=1
MEKYEQTSIKENIEEILEAGVKTILLHKESAIRFETGSCTLIFRLSSLIMGPTVFRLSTISSAV